MKNKLAAWIALGLIAVVAAACLATTNEVTKDIIEAQNVAAMQDAWVALVPDAEFPEGTEAAESEDGVPEEYTYAGLVDGTPQGYVAQTVVQGYGGPIEVIVGTDTEGVISGIKVGGSGFQETAGLGAKAKDAAFTDQFVGKTVPLSVGEEIDAITASTITSNAVVRGVNAAVENIAAVAGFTIDMPAAEAGAIGDGRYAATTKGFAGPVYVEIQLDDNDVITEIVIGDDSFAETAGYGLKAQEPSFYEQFLGKTGQLTLGEDIDGIGGATITSKAVVDAVNTAMLYATDPEAAAAAAEGSKFELPEVPDDALTSTASSKGFGGPVAANITIDKDSHTLLRVEFGDDNWAETDGIGTRIHDDDFWQQFIGKTLPLADGDVDMLTGATITSEGAFAAVNKAYYKLFPDAEPMATPEPAPEPAADANNAKASSKGFGGPVAASITIDENNVLTAVTFGDENWAETDGLGTKVQEDDFINQLVGKTLPLADGDVDLIAGATVTSEAAVAAVNKAYDKIVEAREGGVEAGEGQTASASSKGFGGPVAATITVDENSVLTAVTFGDDNWAETDGLGTKIHEDDFINQFIGKTLPLTEGDIDLIAGATMTSEAAVAAVNKAFDKLAPADEPAEEPAADQPKESADPYTASASSKGFGGPVAATITIDDANTLTAVTFGDDNWAETDGLGTKIHEDDFVNQFIGKTLPLAEGDIDLIAGATVTSEAAVAAVNKAFDKLAPADEPAEEPTADQPEEAADPYTASASSKGFGGPIAATITVDKNNVLTAVTFGDDNWAETDGLGTKIHKDDFINQFIGKTLPLAEGDIDLIAGATVTSEAAVAAVNKAFDKLAPADEPAEEPAADQPEEPADPYTASASSKGFGGPVAATITVDKNNVLTAVTFGDDNWAETDGLGTKIHEDDFVNQFIGKTLPLAEGDIDLIAGATVTSEAAVAAVNKAFDKLAPADESAEEPAADRPEEPADPYTASASSKGFGGPVAANITIDENNTLTAVTFGDDNWAETDGLGTKIHEDDFVNQFIGKTLPLAEGDIDLIAGATVTSEAAVAAVNKAFDKLAPAGESAEEPAADQPEEPADPYTASASSKGFGGPVAATITVDDTNTLTAVTFGDDNWAETDGLGTKIHEDDFVNQFIGKTLPLAEGDIDLIAGATVTSEAAVAAVNKAFDKLVPADEPAEEPAADQSEEPADPYTASASSKGFGGPVAATITIDDTNTLTAVTFGDDNWAETDGLGTKIQEDDFVNQFIGKTLPLAEGDIDLIAGATVTSEAAVAAVNKAFDKLAPANESAEEPVADQSEEPADPYTASASSKGFGGPVAATITVDETNTLTAVTFGDDNWAETDGLGTKIQEDDFVNQFIGKSLPLAEGDIDLIAGATVTSEAAVAAVNKAFDKLAPADESAEEPTPDQPEETNPHQATASFEGYNGRVAVTLTVDTSNAITEITFGDDDFAETDGIGTKILEPAFAEQFIGKTLPLQPGDVDFVSGATVTSRAAVTAVNKAYGCIVAARIEAGVIEVPEEGGNISVASTHGYTGDVSARIVFDDDSVLTAVSFGDENWAEEGEEAKELVHDSTFSEQFIGKTLPLVLDEYDMITGATITSEAAVNAINEAYAKLIAMTEAPVPQPTPVAEASEAPARDSAYWTGTANFSFDGDKVSATLTVDDEDHVENIAIVQTQTASNVGTAYALSVGFLNEIIGKALPLNADEIDAIATATLSNEEAVAAINAAYAKILNARGINTPVPTPVPSSYTVTGEAKGFGGPVAAKVTFDRDHVITGLEFGDKRFAETVDLGTQILEDAFEGQFIGKVPPIAAEDIDSIAGATITSQAAIDAVNDAYAQLLPEEEVLETGVATVEGYNGRITVSLTVDQDNYVKAVDVSQMQYAGDSTGTAYGLSIGFMNELMQQQMPLKEGDIDAVASATVSSEATIAALNKAFDKILEQRGETPVSALRTASGSARGAGGPILATLTVDADGAITDVTFGDEHFAETKGLGDQILTDTFRAQFIGKRPPLVEGDIDSITGATISSHAAVNAVNEAFAAIQHPETAEPEIDVMEPEVGINTIVGAMGRITVKLSVDRVDNVLGLTITQMPYGLNVSLPYQLDAAFMKQLTSQTMPVEDGEIDAIASATVDNEQVIHAINGAYEKILQARGEAQFASFYEGLMTQTASVKGAIGPIAARITVDDDNTITAIRFGDEYFAETDNQGSLVLQPGFYTQFLGKTLPIEDGDVDFIAGATISSAAAVEAVNKAFEQLQGLREIAAKRTGIATVNGMHGPIEARVRVNDQLAITGILIGGEDFNETPGLGGLVRDPAFTEQFIGATPPLNATDFDLIGGATVSSEAVIEAINDAYEQIMMVINEDEEEVPEETAEEPAGNTIAASSKGYGGPVEATITVDEGGVLTAVTFGGEQFAETPGLGTKIQDSAFVDQFIGKTLPLGEGDIDLISGATVSSEAAVAAVNKAYDKLLAQ